MRRGLVLWLFILLIALAMFATGALADGLTQPGDPEPELPGMERATWTGTLGELVLYPILFFVLMVLGN